MNGANKNWAHLQNFAISEKVVNNFGRSYGDMI